MELVSLLSQDIVLISTSKKTLKDSAELAVLLSGFGEEQPIYLVYARSGPAKRRPICSVDSIDAEKMERLEEAILKDLSLPPCLVELSRMIGISLTKMKVMFQQVFGDTIFDFYQKARMNEAARLLTRHTVSETGYYLGFSNISHFGRVFEKHYHLKPKKFKETLRKAAIEKLTND